LHRPHAQGFLRLGGQTARIWSFHAPTSQIAKAKVNYIMLRLVKAYSKTAEPQISQISQIMNCGIGAFAHTQTGFMTQHAKFMATVGQIDSSFATSADWAVVPSA
jgi:hypothetical protein